MNRPPHHALWLPKRGSTPREYEDAFALAPPDADGVVRAVAVADGATETAFARAWAEALARGLAGSPVTTEALSALLPEARAAWQSGVDARAATLPWYAAAKAEQGAGATLLGLRLLPGGTWRALALGDACLFRLAEGENGLALLAAWPFDDPAAFDNRPDLLTSLPSAPPSAPLVTEGEWRPGDVFLLATDALAAFLLAQDRAAEAASWTPETFAEVVDSARESGALKNDDVTLAVLRA